MRRLFLYMTATLMILFLWGCQKNDYSEITDDVSEMMVQISKIPNETENRAVLEEEKIEPSASPTATPEPTATPIPTPTPTPVPEAKLMFTGDLMCLSAQQNAVKSGSDYDFNASFTFVKDIFETADVVFGNLETLCTDDIPYTGIKKEYDGRPVCNGPSKYLDAVKNAGFDILVTANNHTVDALVPGIEDTINELEARDFEYVGTAKPSDNQYRGYIIHEVNGIKLGVLAYTELHNRRYDMKQEDLLTYTNNYDYDRMCEDIKNARTEGADFIIVYIHWGVEHTHELTSGQKKDAKEIANAGADLIIGSHPHCLQHYEYIETEDGRNVLCMFSMGNFVSSMAREIHNQTIILECDIRMNEEGKTELADMSYITCYVFSSYNGESYVIVPTDSELNGGDTSTILSEENKKIEDILENRLVFENTEE